MQTLNFQKQNLKLDFITFTIQNPQHPQHLLNIAHYFHTFFRFNCFLSVGNNRKIREILFRDHHTKDTLIIRHNFWNHTVLEFPGQSANYLYQFLKQKNVDWNFLQIYQVRLIRLDISYDQPKSFSFSNEEFDDFLVHSRSYILENTKTKTIKLLNNDNTRILGINRRSNPRYYRVYQRKHQIRFELELKKQVNLIVLSKS